ncbi:MAG: hypothetical protein AB7P37_01000 [Ramlibacter sp.]
MFTLIAQLTQLRQWMGRADAPATAHQPEGEGVAHQLMERAGSRAGLNPRQARELRRAASAYLSVVR